MTACGHKHHEPFNIQQNIVKFQLLLSFSVVFPFTCPEEKFPHLGFKVLVTPQSMKNFCLLSHTLVDLSKCSR